MFGVVWTILYVHQRTTYTTYFFRCFLFFLHEPFYSHIEIDRTLLFSSFPITFSGYTPVFYSINYYGFCFTHRVPTYLALAAIASVMIKNKKS